MTLRDALRSVSAYPVPGRTIDEICLRRGLDPDSTPVGETTVMRRYNLARADLLRWLSRAPAVSQGGQSYSFSDEQRRQMLDEADAIKAVLDPDGIEPSRVEYGYKGDRL